MLPREYAWLALIVILALSLWWFGYHERGVERDKLFSQAATDRQALVDEYTQLEKTWRKNLQVAGDRADAAESVTLKMAAAAPVIRVVRQSCPPAAPAALPATGPGAAEVSRTPAGNGVLPEASNSGIAEGGIYDAGPALRADAEKCDAMSVQLNYWIDRYLGTQPAP